MDHRALILVNHALGAGLAGIGPRPTEALVLLDMQGPPPLAIDQWPRGCTFRFRRDQHIAPMDFGPEWHKYITGVTHGSIKCSVAYDFIAKILEPWLESVSCLEISRVECRWVWWDTLRVTGMMWTDTTRVGAVVAEPIEDDEFCNWSLALTGRQRKKKTH